MYPTNPDAARQKIRAAKRDPAFVNLLLRGDRYARNRMQRLFATAFPADDPANSA